MDEYRKQLEERAEEAEFELLFDDYLTEWGEALQQEYEAAKQRGEAPEMPEDMKNRLLTFIANYDGAVDPAETSDLREDSAGKTDKAPSIRRSGKWLRRFGVAAATIAILIGTLFTAQAVGFDVFGSIVKWTDSVLHYERSADTKSEERDNTPSTKQLRYALLSLNLPEDYAPTWLPEQFEVTELQTDNRGDKSFASMCLSSPEGGWIIIKISKIKKSDEMYVEKSDNAEVFDANGRRFLLFHNNDTLAATWSNGVDSISVHGLVDNNTMEKILNSIRGDTYVS